MKKLFLLAWPIALAAVSCSNEEVVSVNNDANEITFTAVAENATRAADAYCNAFMPADFNVWARVGEAQYFADVKYTRVDETTIYKAEERRQNFGQVRNSYIRIYDAKTNTEIARYDLDEDFSIETAVEFGRLYRHNGEWKFEAIGNGNKGGLQALVNKYAKQFA